MKSKIIIFLICFELLGCSSLISIETNSKTNKNNNVQIDDSQIDTGVKPYIECTLLSIKISAFEYLYFPIENRNSTLKISSGGRISGVAVLNSFFGEYTKKENNINFGNISITRVNCVDCNDIERLITNKLSEINNFIIDDEKLLLKRDSEVLMIYRIN